MIKSQVGIIVGSVIGSGVLLLVGGLVACYVCRYPCKRAGKRVDKTKDKQLNYGLDEGSPLISKGASVVGLALPPSSSGDKYLPTAPPDGGDDKKKYPHNVGAKTMQNTLSSAGALPKTYVPPPASAPPAAPSRPTAIEPFTTLLRLSHVAFPGGLAALPALYNRAQGGAFGKVIIGTFSHSGTPVAIKVLLGAAAAGHQGTDRSEFMRESENLLRIRQDVDNVHTKAAYGGVLSPEDTGARHIVYCYGTGEERDLSAIHPALPPGPAFLIAIEPLEETLAQRMEHYPGGRLPIAAIIRAAHEIALGLAFIAKNGVVVGPS